MAMAVLQRIVVGTDLSEISPALYALAHTLARQAGAHLVVAYVADPEEYDELRRERPMGVDEFVERFRGSILLDFEDATGGARPAQVVVRMRERGVAEDLLQIAADVRADLVVVGTHGRTGLRRVLLGSVAEAVMRQATVPVLVVPHGAAATLTPAPRTVPTTTGGAAA
jgi:nucleotide-binding universal stress UspA family protein